MTTTMSGPAIRPTHRSTHERLVVAGALVLDTPASFGNGDPGDTTDMPLLVDEVDGRPLITGASLAGALRNYLREHQQGYDRRFDDDPRRESRLDAAALFGGHRGDPDGDQSPLIVDDAPAVGGLVVAEMRDGVAINPATGAAAEGKKYDYELLPAGTRFGLRFELLLDNKHDDSDSQRRLAALAQALHALQQGEVRLGARKRRGFGRCHVDGWAVTRYSLTDPADLVAWLESGPEEKDANRAKQGGDVFSLLGAAQPQGADARRLLEVEATFAVDGSLLVRSGSGLTGPDMVHLQTYDTQRRGPAPVLPGTSLGGALRHRALRIASTLAQAEPAKEGRAGEIVSGMFGPEKIVSGETPWASRLVVEEQFLEGGTSLVQSRVKIDRFTGGTVDGALFDEAPHFGGRVTLRLSLRNPQDAEVGLLLLLLKDLWLGDLTLGGEASVGRGRLRGERATLRLPGCDAPITLAAGQEDGSVVLTGAREEDLQKYVDALAKSLTARNGQSQEAEA